MKVSQYRCDQFGVDCCSSCHEDEEPPYEICLCGPTECHGVMILHCCRSIDLIAVMTDEEFNKKIKEIEANKILL